MKFSESWIRDPQVTGGMFIYLRSRGTGMAIRHEDGAYLAHSAVANDILKIWSVAFFFLALFSLTFLKLSSAGTVDTHSLPSAVMSTSLQEICTYEPSITLTTLFSHCSYSLNGQALLRPFSGHNPTSHSESSSSLAPDVSPAPALASALPLHTPPDTQPQSFRLLFSVVRVPQSTPLSLVPSSSPDVHSLLSLGNFFRWCLQPLVSVHYVENQTTSLLSKPPAPSDVLIPVTRRACNQWAFTQQKAWCQTWGIQGFLKTRSHLKKLVGSR